MTADSMSENLQKAQQERQQAQAEEIRKIMETWKSDFQSSLLAESKNFRNSIAATERKVKRLLWAASVITALAVLTSSVLILESLRTAHQMSQQAQLMLGSQTASESLRELDLIPVGNLVKGKDGKTYIEVKPSE